MFQDSFGRNIHYLRISLTDHGNLRCVYCMPELRDDEGDLRPLLRGGASYEALKQRMSEWIYCKPWGMGGRRLSSRYGV
jgi:hypothetical protein